ncbi:MAG: excinuclease ABC subunit UvrA [Succinivibrionaceae bacterium]|jgi:excinuclease ABC subunit A|nr:excinuclease ABC subunit UvrA [Succinivibrionaceae bacterium]
MESIEIRGARTHNLKNIDLIIPRDKLVVITGLSGSGKSSLAFDTLYAEGQRRYVESLSPYARQFLSLMEKPDVDHIEGLSPAISIEQKSTSHNPRSTVGTITEIYDYLRLLFARVGEAKCPVHKLPLKAQTISQMVDQVMKIEEGVKLMILAPVVNDRKGEYKQLLHELLSNGFTRARIDGELYDLSEPPQLELRKKHTIEVVIDRFKVKAGIQQRITESFETALNLSDGIVYVDYMDSDKQSENEKLIFSNKFACPLCGYSIKEIEPRMFSFNNPSGACPNCDGLGFSESFDPQKIVANPEISISNGAIKGWDKRCYYYYQSLLCVANYFGFSLDVPFNELTEEQQDLVLNGTGNQEIPMIFLGPNGESKTVNRPFEGVINNMARRYRETESAYVRDDLARYLTSSVCKVCGGSRLNEAARNVYIEDINIPKVVDMSIIDAHKFFMELQFFGQKLKIAEKVLKEIRERLGFLENVGLGYLSLSRTAETLSGGEAQRIRLASQIGAGLVGVMYVLDEPSIGLHQRDNGKLLDTLFHLRDIGNSVIVVEHDEDAMRAADYLVDIGPGAGVHGGEVIACGTPEEVMKNESSLTGAYLSGRKYIAVPKHRLPPRGQWLTIYGARGNNLKNVDLKIPVGLMTCVTGVSGSGKSTLINDTLYKIAFLELNGGKNAIPSPYDRIDGLDNFDKVIAIDQSPIGRTPRSNPATYTGIFTTIRDLFAANEESRARGYTSSRFSFNVKGGRCEACEGDGVIKVEMNFLPDVYVPCDECHGQRFNRETLEIKYKGKNINDVLNMSVEEALEFFCAIPTLKSKLQTLADVGLSYISLGQSATMLSGGEAQRIKLAKELSRKETSRTLYILDEPTTGLHFRDVSMLLDILKKLRDKGNTIVIIEHNLDVIKTVDYIVDLGPEGGSGGGQIIATGTPEEICSKYIDKSYTAQYLSRVLKNASYE